MMLKGPYFQRSGYIKDSKIETDSGYELDMRLLPSFLRTLMVMDGTVTKSLAAWFWEPVKVKPLSNKVENLQEVINSLQVRVGNKVLHREVALIGEQSERVFAYARSTVSLDDLPVEIGKSLESGKIGIGEILREQGIETYREIYRINYTKKEECDDPLLSGILCDIISRSYRIRVNSIPSIVVTEYFPLDLYRF